MAEQTQISWADSTANLWIGCQKVSPACDNCYAEELMDSRYGRVEWGPHGARQLCKSGWQDVRRWQGWALKGGAGGDPRLGRRRRIFINSLSDFFDNHRTVVWRDDAWNLFRQCPDLIFMLLTKRPQNIAGMLPPFWDEIAERVWLLTTVENQTEADRRIPELLTACVGRARAAVRGLSCEPLLGPLDLSPYMPAVHHHPDNRERNSPSMQGLVKAARDSLGGGVDWVIVGGESGRNARPMHPRWPLDLRDQCIDASVPFHFKQWGEWRPHTPKAGGDLGGDVRSGRVTTVHPTGQTEVEVFRQTGGRNTIPGTRYVERAGKAKTGHLLGGHEHLEFPNVA